jgi:hypothetical protein
VGDVLEGRQELTPVAIKTGDPPSHHARHYKAGGPDACPPVCL